MLSGRAFQVAGPACQNARSPNFVRSRDREYSPPAFVYRIKRKINTKILKSWILTIRVVERRRLAPASDVAGSVGRKHGTVKADRADVAVKLNRRIDLDQPDVVLAIHPRVSFVHYRPLYAVALLWRLLLPSTMNTDHYLVKLRAELAVLGYPTHTEDYLYTQGEVTSQDLWSRYDRHFVGITWHNLWS